MRFHRYTYSVAVLALALFLSVMWVFSVSAQTDNARPSAYSPRGIMALDVAIRTALGEGDKQAAWDLARQHLDFQYMPANLLLRIAKLAANMQSPERAQAIVQRALQSYPEHSGLHHYGLILASYLRDCNFVQDHQANYQRPHQIAWRDDFLRLKNFCTQQQNPVRKQFSLNAYRGSLPYHGGRGDVIRAEPRSFVDNFCDVFTGICPASREFSVSETPPDRHILKTSFGVHKIQLRRANLTKEMRLNWQHYQAAKLGVFADDVEVGLKIRWLAKTAKHHILNLRVGSYASQPPADQTPYHTNRIMTDFGQIYQLDNAGWTTGIHKLRPDFWGWQAGIAQHLRPEGSLSVLSISEFQKWQFDDTILNMSFGREQLDYPAAVLAGDARSQFWLVEVDHSFPAGFAGGYLSRLTLGHGVTNIGYARALPWLRRPHHIKRSRSSLRATFAETVFSLVPTLTIEQITSRSRNLADNYDETEFSFSISRSY
ncbi:MAG: hypothetical protein ACON5P_06290 [Candidatus Puniceispirillaceae bacterium]